MFRKDKRIHSFDWVTVFTDAMNVEFYAQLVLKDRYLYDYIGSLTTLSLKEGIKCIRDAEVRDYYEHLVFVAEETLKMLDQLATNEKSSG